MIQVPPHRPVGSRTNFASPQRLLGMDMNVKRRRGTGWIWPEEGKEKVVVVGSSPWWGSLDGQHASSRGGARSTGERNPSRGWEEDRPPNRDGGWLWRG